jgi:hypothetical protein
MNVRQTQFVVTPWTKKQRAALQEAFDAIGGCLDGGIIAQIYTDGFAFKVIDGADARALAKALRAGNDAHRTCADRRATALRARGEQV